MAVELEAERRGASLAPAIASAGQRIGLAHAQTVSDGQMLYLFSTFDENIDLMADLYEKRWRAETNIDQFKSTLCGEAFRSKTVEMVHKELLMAIVSYNLTVQVRRLAAQKGGVAPRELSLQSVWSLVIVFFQCIAGVRTEQEIAEEFEKLIDLAGKKKLPKRKKPRSYQSTRIRNARSFRHETNRLRNTTFRPNW